ncbi:MAG TPA: acyl-CoA dehydrogenase family protein [Alcanivorax sp.]|nr:acyl-CoA dehydrogenase family protein [Alcanivorax sp.]
MAKDAIGFALSALNRLAGSSMLDRLGMRHTAERLAYRLTKGGFQVITTSARAFKSSNPSDKPQRLDAPGHTTGLFDLGITDEQQMIRDSVRAFAAEVLREHAEQSDAEQRTSDDVQNQARELGLNFFAVPEALGGAAAERSTVTSMLVAEELARGDMGQAVAVLAPMGVANALTRWGSALQQDKYLSTFAGEDAPLATIAVCEPRPLFDPMALRTTATRDGDDWIISGEKSLVPLAAEAELFLVAAATDDGPAVFIVEGGSEGLSAGEDPAMGIRASGQRPLLLDKVRVPAANRLGDDDFNYREFIDLGTLAWCALAIGTAQAVLDYVVPYCNERKAFGEPISHRQAVAFMVADIAIELDAMRMLTYRAVCRAEQGRSFQREAHLARTLVKDKAMQIGTDGVQLLGGHGFTHEYPVERWYRDLRATGVVFGGLHL